MNSKPIDIMHFHGTIFYFTLLYCTFDDDVHISTSAHVNSFPFSNKHTNSCDQAQTTITET